VSVERLTSDVGESRADSPPRRVHRVLIGWDIGATGAWGLQDCIYGQSPDTSASSWIPPIPIASLISPNLREALHACNDLGEEIFDHRRPDRVDASVKRAFTNLASFFAKAIQSELGREWEVLYLDVSNSETRVQRSI
jgi:hypothetical protein